MKVVKKRLSIKAYIKTEVVKVYAHCFLGSVRDSNIVVFALLLFPYRKCGKARASVADMVNGGVDSLCQKYYHFHFPQ